MILIILILFLAIQSSPPLQESFRLDELFRTMALLHQSHGRGIEKTTHTPITVELRLRRPPKLMENIWITCVLRSVLDAPHTVAHIELPDGAKRVRGDLNWEGHLKRNIPIVFSAKIQFVKAGNWTITARANHKIDDENSWGDTDSIYLNVARKRGRFGFGDASGNADTELSKRPRRHQ
jgi:hypothetical protein